MCPSKVADPATSWKDWFVVSAKITEEEGEGLRTCEGRVMTDKLWAVLPVELQWEIWTWLPPQETYRQMEVCRAWHENCSDDRFWQAVHMRHDLFQYSLPYALPAINLAPLQLKLISQALWRTQNCCRNELEALPEESNFGCNQGAGRLTRTKNLLVSPFTFFFGPTPLHSAVQRWIYFIFLSLSS